MSLVIDGLTGIAEDYPIVVKQPKYKCKLNTKSDCRKEMAKIYRESRAAVIATQDATRQIYILQMISKEIVEAPIEPKECKSKTGLAYFYEKCGFEDEQALRDLTDDELSTLRKRLEQSMVDE